MKHVYKIYTIQLCCCFLSQKATEASFEEQEQTLKKNLLHPGAKSFLEQTN